MKTLPRLLYVLVVLAPVAAFAASPFDGRWRLDPTRSSPLDGWTAWDLVISVENNRVSLEHDMTLRTTQVTGTNVVDTVQPTKLKDFFRVQQRHMAVYAAKGGETAVRAAWLDDGRTLRVEADVPVEVSQGQTNLRIYSEYRLIEGDDTLELVELHRSRPRPLLYRFTKVTSGK